MECYVRALSANELKLLLRLYDYNDPDAMISENTKAIGEGRIEIFGLFREGCLIGELRVAYKHNDERFAVINKRVYLYAFRIRKELQASGYGSFLINAVISTLSEKGYSEFTVGVEDDNEVALHIYSRLGFTHLIGRIEEEYQGDGYEYGLYLKTLQI